MRKKSLTEARVRMLKPRKTARHVRDGKLRGFGVRVLPSGKKRFFIHCQYAGERNWKVIGSAGLMTVGEARLRAGEMLAAIRRGEGLPVAPEATLSETIAETVFLCYERIWKVRTLTVNQSYLRSQLLPYFAAPDRRHRTGGRAELVRLARRNAGRGEPVYAGAVRHHAGSGTNGPAAQGFQPLQGHPALSPQATRALPHRRRAPPPVFKALCPCGAVPASGRRHPASPAYGVPQERDPDAALVRLPRRSPLSARQKDRDIYRLLLGACTQLRGRAIDRYVCYGFLDISSIRPPCALAEDALEYAPVPCRSCAV